MRPARPQERCRRPYRLGFRWHLAPCKHFAGRGASLKLKIFGSPTAAVGTRHPVFLRVMSTREDLVYKVSMRYAVPSLLGRREPRAWVWGGGKRRGLLASNASVRRRGTAGPPRSSLPAPSRAMPLAALPWVLNEPSSWGGSGGRGPAREAGQRDDTFLLSSQLRIELAPRPPRGAREPAKARPAAAVEAREPGVAAAFAWPRGPGMPPLEPLGAPTPAEKETVPDPATVRPLPMTCFRHAPPPGRPWPLSLPA